MYKIIGGDGNQYGPIGLDQLRAWIAEGRANAKTLAQIEGSPDWRPLGTFPELAGALGLGIPAATQAPVAPVGFQPAGGRDAAFQAVRGPAIALKVTAILGFIAAAVSIVANFVTIAGGPFRTHSRHNPEFEWLVSAVSGGFGIIGNFVGVAIGVLILIGAGKLERLENHSFALAAAVLAMVPCVSPCCWLGIPFGIWALVVMNRPEVKSQFT